MYVPPWRHVGGMVLFHTFLPPALAAGANILSEIFISELLLFNSAEGGQKSSLFQYQDLYR